MTTQRALLARQSQHHKGNLMPIRTVGGPMATMAVKRGMARKPGDPGPHHWPTAWKAMPMAARAQSGARAKAITPNSIHP